MQVSVLIDEGFQGRLEEDWLRSVALTALAAEQVEPSAEAGLVITGQERIRELNALHLGDDRPTDVLAFPMLPTTTDDPETPAFVAPPDGAVHLGEVIVSYPQAAIQAEERQHPVEEELALLIVHGVLHLLGYDHDTPERERQMRAREAEILGRLEVPGR